MDVQDKINRRRSAAWSLLVPAAALFSVGGILWFMNRAVANEQLAARQRLVQAYGAQLERTASSIREHWRARAFGAEEAATGVEPSVAFHRLVLHGPSDGAVIRQENGVVVYPGPVFSHVLDEDPSPSWRDAEHAEFAENAPREAAARYQLIAAVSADPQLRARAVIAQARSLAKSGATTEALSLLTDSINGGTFDGLHDARGHLLIADSEWAALQLDRDNRTTAAEQLKHRLLDYEDTRMTSSQRRFLLTELQSRAPDEGIERLARAESLSGRFLEAGGGSAVSGLTAAPLPDHWQLGTPHATLILSEERLKREAAPLIAQAALPEGVTLEFQPVDEGTSLTAGMSVPIGRWQLAVHFSDSDPFSAAASRNVAWTIRLGAGLALFTALAGVFAARHVRQQMRLAQMKTDLAAIVSHELRTPLAGIRAIVDTMAAGRLKSPGEMEEYLGMLSGESARLERVIENFLILSRFRRREPAKLREVVPVDDMAREAVLEAEARFRQAGFELETKFDAAGAMLTCDRTALLSCLDNLLENALKYHADTRWVSVRTRAPDGWVTLEVEDRGIGIPRAEHQRIFESFYQIDQSLSRRVGGAGLGLSIVKTVIEAHGGEVLLTSERGRGSLFTLRLPRSDGEY